MKSFYSQFSFKLFLISAILLVSNSFGQGIPDALRLAEPGLGSSARALGMGNSYIGLSDDASAAFYNPAGFGLLKRMEFSGGLNYLNFDNNSTFFRNTTNYSNSSTKLNRISFAFPFPTTRGSLVFGVSYHSSKDFTSAVKFDGFNNGTNSLARYLSLQNNDVPYNLYLSYPLKDAQGTYIKDTTNIFGNLNQSGTILSSGSVDNWTFSGAIEVSKNLFIGANLNIITGNYDNNNDYYEDDTKNVYQGETSPGDVETKDFRTFYLNKKLNWDISGWDAKIGALYQFRNFARFGATIQFPKTYSIKEKFDVFGRSEFGTAQSFTYSANDQVEYDITTPFELAGGASVNVRGFIFSGQATILDYTQTKFGNAGNGLDQRAIDDINTNIKDQLRAVVNYNLGVEYTIPRIGLRLRGGYFIQPSAYQGDPSEFDKKYVTAGFGFLTEETIGIDFAYAHGWWNTFGDNYGSDLSRTQQQIKTNNFSLTVTYRF